MRIIKAWITNKIMSSESVKLYGVWGSPFSRRVEIALNLKGIPYEYIEEDIHNKSPELLKYNPVHKKIPILVHNGKPIAESVVIIEYIDETWPDNYPILPKDPYERALARFWVMFIEDKCRPSIWKAFSGPEEGQAKASEEAQENLTILEKHLEETNTTFFGGDQVGFVDIVASLFARWMGPLQEATGKKIFAKEQYPYLSKWSVDFVSCDIVKESLPERARLLEFLKARFAK